MRKIVEEKEAVFSWTGCKDFVHISYKHRWLFVINMIIFVMIGSYVYKFQTETYEANALIQIGKLGENQNIEDSALIVEFLKNEGVLRNIFSEDDNLKDRDLTEYFKFSFPIKDKNVLRIEAVAARPMQAYKMVKNVCDYVVQRHESIRQSYIKRLDTIYHRSLFEDYQLLKEKLIDLIIFISKIKEDPARKVEGRTFLAFNGSIEEYISLSKEYLAQIQARTSYPTSTLVLIEPLVSEESIKRLSKDIILRFFIASLLFSLLIIFLKRIIVSQS